MASTRHAGEQQDGFSLSSEIFIVVRVRQDTIYIYQKYQKYQKYLNKVRPFSWVGRGGMIRIQSIVTSLSPRIPAIIRNRQAIRAASRDSPKSTIPRRTVPIAPIPVQTA